MKSIFLHFGLFYVVFLLCTGITQFSYAQVTAGNLTVLQANGASSAADSVTINEYNTSTTFQTGPVSTIGLPASGAGPFLTVSGSAGSDGHMSLDSELTHLIIGGYNAVAGTSGVSAGSGINRSVFSMAPSGTITNVADVSQTNCFKTNNFRSATAAGNRYFGGGAGSGGTGGVQYMSGSSNTQVNTTILNSRVVHIFNGQLYFSTNNTTPGIHSVGVGIPSTSGNPITQLPGVGSSSPYGFALSPDNNTLYVADDIAGILKYTRTGGIGPFSAPVTVNAITCRGLTVDFTTTPYKIYATTSFVATSNALIRITDGSATVDTLALAPVNTFFKSVTFAPSAFAKIQGGGTTICSGSSDNIKFYGNPGDSITYTVNGITNGIRLDNTGMAIMNTGALTAINNDSIYTYSLVTIETSLGITPVSGSVAITVNPAATAPITGAGSICNGSSLTLSNLSTGGSWSTIATGVATVNSSGFVTSAGAGSAVITYSISNVCGTISDTAVVVVNPIPSIVITPVSSAICNGSNTNITASGAATYTWTPSAGLSATTGATVNCNTTIARTYTVTGNSLGCIGSNTQTITVNPIPVLTVTPVSSIFCNGSNTNITASGATTYSWLPSSGLSATAGAAVNCSAAATTTYTVSGTSLGCVGTATQVITVNPIPVLTVTPGSATICNGTITTITAAGAASYSWSPSSGLSSTVASVVTFNSGTTTTYTVSGTSLGCTGSSTQTITVNPIPVLTVTPSFSSICNNGSNTGITASGASSYSWTPSASLSAAGGSFVIASPTVTTTYTVSGTSLGCTGTAAQTITVNPIPVVTVTPVSAFLCNGSNINITATGASSFTWAPATGLSVTTGSTVNCSAATTTIYTVTGISLGCGGTSTQTITVNPVPVLTVTPVASVMCSGSNTNITASGAAAYAWSPSSGLSATTGATVNSSTAITRTYTITGTTAGCTGSAVQTITVNPVPVLTVTPVFSTICNGANTNISAAGATSFTWLPATGLSTTVGSTVNSSAASTVTYTVSGTSSGCTGTSLQTITVNPVPVVTVTPVSTAICNGSTTSISAAGAATYSWAPSVGLDATTGPGVVCNANTTTTYTVSGTTLGCTGTTVHTITVNAVPVLTVTPVSSTFCNGSNTNITAAGAATYTWSPSAGLSSTAGSSVNCSASTTTTYTVSGSAAGCTGTSLQTITVNPIPVLTVTPGAAAICNGTSTTIAASGAASYTWTPSIGLSVATGSLVTCSPTTTTTYSVTGTTLGCAGSAIRTITVNQPPNAGLITGTPIVCEAAITTLSNAATGGTWNSSSPNATVAGGVVSGISTGGAIISYTVSNICGTATDTMAVTINPQPHAGTITGMPILCAASVTTLSNTTTGGTWSSSSSSATVAGGIVSGISAGNAIISYSVTNSCGTAVDTIAITINPLPNAGIYPSAATICIGSLITLSGGIAGGIWSSVSPAISLVGGVVTGVDTGSGSVRYIVTNSCGTDTGYAMINVDIAPAVALISGDNDVCIGSSTVFSEVIPGGIWSSSNPGVAAVSGSTVLGVSAGTAVITYMLTNACGTAITSKAIIVHSLSDCHTGIVTANELEEGVSIYPNPATNKVYVKSSVSVNIVVYSPDGKLLISQDDTHEIDVHDLSAGLYIIMVYDVNNSLLKIERLIKMD